jgi:hypothetical protein
MDDCRGSRWWSDVGNEHLFQRTFSNASTTPEAFWSGTVFETRVFEPKHYLYPIHQRELDRNELITQNYGW